jgi:hypothetical protein
MTTPGTGRLIDLDGDRAYAIDGYDAMAPFLITVASDSDHWMFVSSSGALTAGRRDPDGALFPYTTDDRLHDAAAHTGPKTLVRIARPGQPPLLWEPFSTRSDGRFRVSRTLAKSLRGNRLRFEEVNHDLALRFSYEWTTSERFGFVRRACLRNEGDAEVALELLDGLQNLMPAGLDHRFQMAYSTLADAYKDNEALGALGLFRLASLPVDAPEPSESLRATTVWPLGLPAATALLSSGQLSAFRQGQALSPERRICGRRGAYFVHTTLTLAREAEQRWALVADVEQDAAAVVATAERLQSPDIDIAAALDADVAQGTRNLVRIVAAADGLSRTASELRDARHFSNVLFNVMRGGLPEAGFTLEREDVARFIGRANRRVHERHRAFLEALPARFSHDALLAAPAGEGIDDPDLERLVHEYLPFSFSRRHGDPSRPWNLFRIAVKDASGPRRDYQGNWRDLFQNWEALALSFPGYVESMIVKFVDSSTLDGHNPYRVSREGYEWEIHDPTDAWSYIGYWGDHQVIYLQKLLELSQRHHPGRLRALLGRRWFTFANVPYRWKPFGAVLADPRHTVDFDEAAHRAALAAAEALGSDGRALLDATGEPVRATLAEKLVIMALAKLANYIPTAGLWLVTQRPEWNDANNALVGNGASVVTLAYLRRFLAFARHLFGGAEAQSFVFSTEVAEAFARMHAALRAHAPPPASATGARALLEALARPWSDYRRQIYARGFSGATTLVHARDVAAFCEAALQHVDHTLRSNRRDDGLYHAYNLVQVRDDEVVTRRLPEMLEGQVAILSAGLLSASEALVVLDALRASRLYRADQCSYLLYPARVLPSFLDKNRIPAEAVARSSLLTALLAADDRRIVVRDARGDVRFHADFRNSDRLAHALDQLAYGPFAALARAERSALLALYERVFDHQAFTGRSGTFYKYEGLGCIYWHMVSKLLLAVGEVWEAAARKEVEASTLDRLQAHAEQIRDGIGVDKPPALYGAFPFDPYSHTPAFVGVQQPGLTGQVKEDIITRRGELGVVVAAGQVTFRRALFRAQDLLTAPARFDYLDLAGQDQSLALPARTLAFTLCQVPVVVHGAGPPGVTVTWRDQPPQRLPVLALDRHASAALFARSGAITRVDVHLALEGSRP